MTYKLILVETDYDYFEGEDPELTVREGTLSSILTENSEVDFDIDNMSSNLIHLLASGDTKVGQVISKASLKKLMTAEQRKMYDKEKKRLKDVVDKRAATRQKRAEIVNKKQLERARKVFYEVQINS